MNRPLTLGDSVLDEDHLRLEDLVLQLRDAPLDEVSRRLEAVRESDAILREEFANAGLEGKVWQYFTLIPDTKSVGVKDNARSYEWTVILRAVHTVDAMTATIEHIDWAVLDKITRRIVTEVKGVNRVCYDLTPKPTGTIEWE